MTLGLDHEGQCGHLSVYVCTWLLYYIYSTIIDYHSVLKIAKVSYLSSVVNADKGDLRGGF